MVGLQNRITEGIVERFEHGSLILSPLNGRPRRRILHVNAYGGKYVWDGVKQGLIPAHQLLGCLDLVRAGYEIALPEPLPAYFSPRRPLPHDLGLLGLIRNWLGPEGVVFCGHNVLHWIPLLRMIGVVRSPIVSLLYAREPLHFSRAHAGVIALTPSAEEQARMLAPQAKVANLGWGVDLDFFQPQEYRPQWFFSCGIANRDFKTLSEAAAKSGRPFRVVCPGLPPGISWSPNVTLFDGGQGWNIDKTKRFTIPELIRDHFSGGAATLVILKSDPVEYTANGFTNLIEAMALCQPVIVTRTGALPGEIDVEKAGCGLHVPPDDPAALANAVELLAADTRRAAAMGAAGRTLCEERYNLKRYARDLDEFFEAL